MAVCEHPQTWDQLAVVAFQAIALKERSPPNIGERNSPRLMLTGRAGAEGGGLSGTFVCKIRGSSFNSISASTRYQGPYHPSPLIADAFPRKRLPKVDDGLKSSTSIDSFFTSVADGLRF